MGVGLALVLVSGCVAALSSFLASPWAPSILVHLVASTCQNGIGRRDCMHAIDEARTVRRVTCRHLNILKHQSVGWGDSRRPAHSPRPCTAVWTRRTQRTTRRRLLRPRPGRRAGPKGASQPRPRAHTWRPRSSRTPAARARSALSSTSKSCRAASHDSAPGVVTNEPSLPFNFTLCVCALAMALPSVSECSSSGQKQKM